MLKSLHVAVLLGIGLVACTAGVASTSASSVPQQQAEVVSPTSGLHVTASIVAVTLGEECGGASAAKFGAGDCAASPPASADGGSSAAGTTGCGGYCQPSNVQLSFNASAGSQSANIEIVRVELIGTAGVVIDTLTASKPQSWTGSSYAPWDQSVKGATDLKTSYDMTAPAWSKIDSTGSTSSRASKYRLHVTLRIDGVEVVLESTDLSREPLVAT